VRNRRHTQKIAKAVAILVAKEELLPTFGNTFQPGKFTKIVTT
jgi:hypothetical protein